MQHHITILPYYHITVWQYHIYISLYQNVEFDQYKAGECNSTYSFCLLLNSSTCPHKKFPPTIVDEEGSQNILEAVEEPPTKRSKIVEEAFEEF